MASVIKQKKLLEQETKSLKYKAQDFESKARYLSKDDLQSAFDYAHAAKLRTETGEIGKAIRDYEKAASFYNKIANEFSQDTHGREKFTVDAAKYQKCAERLKKLSKGEWHGLEGRITAVVSAISLLGGLFFLSSNLTGNVIGNMTNLTSNWIGGILFAIGLIGAFFYFKNK